MTVKLSQSQQRLAEQYVPLAWKWANNLRRKYPQVDHDELVSEAMHRLSLAALKFRENQASFTTYASVGILRQLYRHVQRNSGPVREFTGVGASRPGDEPDRTLDPIDHRTDFATVLEEVVARDNHQENRRLIDVLREHLDPLLFTILRRHFLEGQTLSAISHQLGKSLPFVRARLHLALVQARMILTREVHRE